MTDREALLALLERFRLQPYSGRLNDSTGADEAVVLMAKEGGVGGYSGFCAAFLFDVGGNFQGVEIVE